LGEQHREKTEEKGLHKTNWGGGLEKGRIRGKTDRILKNQPKRKSLIRRRTQAKGKIGPHKTLSGGSKRRGGDAQHPLKLYGEKNRGGLRRGDGKNKKWGASKRSFKNIEVKKKIRTTWGGPSKGKCHSNIGALIRIEGHKKSEKKVEKRNNHVGRRAFWGGRLFQGR